MHLCLLNAQIQKEISWFASSGTTCQLARTCRSFYEPAMDAIWRSLEGYASLIKCMPSDLWTETEVDGMHVTLGLTREPTPAEWQMFRKHAHRVRSFEDESKSSTWIASSEDGLDHFIHPDTLDMITRHICQYAQRPPASPLFPNLVTLDARSYSGDDTEMVFRSLPFLTGTKLLELYYAASADSHNSQTLGCKELVPVAQVLPLLATSSPGVHKLEIETTSDSVRDLVTGLANLRDLRASIALDERTFVHLSALTRLRILFLNHESGGGLPEQIQVATPHFASLEDVLLDYSDHVLVLSILHTLKGSLSLRRVTINFGPRLSHEEWTDALLAISEIPDIESIAFNLSMMHEDDNSLLSKPVLTGPILATLYTLPRLKRLELLDLADIRIDDGDLQDLASACHLLENIQLCRKRCRQGIDQVHEPTVTLSGLAALRNACPALTFMNIAFGSSIDTEAAVKQVLSDAEVEMIRPITFIVGEGTPSLDLDPSTVATLICDLFPKLQGFNGHNGTHWSRVSEEVRKRLPQEADEYSDADDGSELGEADASEEEDDFDDEDADAFEQSPEE